MESVGDRNDTVRQAKDHSVLLCQWRRRRRRRRKRKKRMEEEEEGGGRRGRRKKRKKTALPGLLRAQISVLSHDEMAVPFPNAALRMSPY